MPRTRTRHGWRSRILKAPENQPGERVECALRIAMYIPSGEVRNVLEMCGLIGYQSAPEHGFVPGGRVSATAGKAKTQRGEEVA